MRDRDGSAKLAADRADSHALASAVEPEAVVHAVYEAAAAADLAIVGYAGASVDLGNDAVQQRIPKCPECMNHDPPSSYEGTLMLTI
jgi:hypothetical protein